MTKKDDVLKSLAALVTPSVGLLISGKQLDAIPSAKRVRRTRKQPLPEVRRELERCLEEAMAKRKKKEDEIEREVQRILYGTDG